MPSCVWIYLRRPAHFSRVEKHIFFVIFGGIQKCIYFVRAQYPNMRGDSR